MDPNVHSLRELLKYFKENNVTGPERYKQFSNFISMSARESRTPVCGLFELTPLCNLSCKMCYVHLSKGQMNGLDVLSSERWKNIMGQAIEEGMLSAVLTGGECLLHPDFKDIYLFLQSKGIEITVKTNGLLIKDDLLQFFCKHPPALLSISVYGSNNETYQAVTGESCFNQVFNNVLAIKKAKIPLIISVVPNASMYDGVQLLKLLHDNGLTWLVNTILFPPNKDTERQLWDAPLDVYENLLKFDYELRGRALEPCCNDLNFPNQIEDSSIGATVNCGAGKSLFAVNWRGELNPCISFTTISKSLSESSFKDAWHELCISVDNYPAPAECTICPMSDSCPKCIVAHREAPLGHADQRVCRKTKYLISKGIKLKN